MREDELGFRQVLCRRALTNAFGATLLHFDAQDFLEKCPLIF